MQEKEKTRSMIAALRPGLRLRRSLTPRNHTKQGRLVAARKGKEDDEEAEGGQGEDPG